MKIKLIVGLFTVFLLTLFFLVSCQIPAKNAETITVTGHAEMSAMPDLARVYTGISILKPTAIEAQGEANKVINAIVNELKFKGILESDIETENLNLYEEKIWIDKESQMKNIGWKATQILKIKTDDFRKVGDIVDVAVNNGANQINSIEFYLSTSKEDESKKLILAKATKNAKSKAETIATSLDVSLDKIISASESNYGYVPYKHMMANSIGDAAISESARIMPSDVIVSADMSLSYSIKQ
jgi:uncharacterized protein YggE